MASRTSRTDLMVRQRNTTAAAIMRTLVREGPSGRKGLASATGATFTTITKTVAELMELGALTEAAPLARRGAGRPVVPLDLPAVGRYVVGAHLHPERTSCGVFTLRGEYVAGKTIPAEGGTQRARIQEAAQLVDDVVTQAGATAVLGIGVTTPWAEVHHQTPPPLASDVDHVELRDSLRERLPHPVRLEPNVRALAVDDYWWGNAADDVLTVLVGRSIRIAQMRAGELIWDSQGAGGLVSHLVVPGSDHSCDCGQIGCVKATCTDDALVRRAVEAELLPPGASQHDLYPEPDTPQLHLLRQARVEELSRVVPLIIGLVAPHETVIRGRLGTPSEISACVEGIKRRYRELVGREATVRYNGETRPKFWMHASAALALDRYLASPLEYEEDRLEYEQDRASRVAPAPMQ